MLDEKDQRALAGIEAGLRAEDPGFVRRMSPPGFPVLSVLCVTVFLALPFVAMFLGPRAALILADLVGLAVVLVLAYRHRVRGL